MTVFGDFETIKIGDTASVIKKITADDIRKFVEMTGDNNPLHVDKDFARSTPFKDIVVHGMLGASFISTVIGTKLPGKGALWVSQSMEFLLPMRLGDEITVTCTVVKKHKNQRLLELDTTIVNQNKQIVLRGHGTVKVLQSNTTAKEHEKGSMPKVAIVTGGAGGIGSAISQRLAAAGFQVIVNYNRNASNADALCSQIEKAGGSACAVQADVSTSEGAEKLVNAAIQRYGGVGVLINNAAPRVNPMAFEDMDWEDFQKHIDVQVKGTVLLCKEALPHMVANRQGRIINIVSQEIEGSPTPKWSAYAVGKSGVATISRYLAAEYGPMGICVNCVSPGMTDTIMLGDIPEKTQLMTARQTPLRKLAKPEDIAGAVVFLATDEASHITGETLRVNGGMVMS